MPAFLKSVLKWGGILLLVGVIAYWAFPCTCISVSKANAMKAASNGRQIAQVLNGTPGQPPRYPSEFPPARLPWLTSVYW